MITINGEKTAVREGTDLLSWLNSSGIHPDAIAVEYNGEILRRPDFGNTVLQNGDKIEIVRFMAGG